MSGICVSGLLLVLASVERTCRQLQQNICRLSFIVKTCIFVALPCIVKIVSSHISVARGSSALAMHSLYIHHQQ